MGTAQMATTRSNDVNDDTAAVTETLKTAEAIYARAHDRALEQPQVRAAADQRQVARDRWRAAQRRKRQTDTEDAERRAASMVTTLAEVEAAISTAESQLAALRSQHLQCDRELDALRRWIADATPKPRRRVLVFFGDDVDPLVPPIPLALLAVDHWQALFAEAQRLKSSSATVLFDEINGWLLEAHHDDPSTRKAP